MKYVYTNENPRLKEFSELLSSDAFKRFVCKNFYSMTEYRSGMQRVIPSKARDELNRFLRKHDMFATDEVEHAHNIGNNNSYYVKDLRNTAVNELFARLDINSDMFGSVYCYGSDIDGNSVTPCYLISNSRQIRTEKFFEPDWSAYSFPVQKAEREGKMISKEVTMTIRVPEGFSPDDELNLDKVIANAIESQGYEFIKAKPYLDVEDKLEFIFDDELCVQDDHCECVDGYLWATDSLVAWAESFLKLDLTPEQLESIENINFFPIFNLKTGSAEIEVTYDYRDKEEDAISKQGNITLKMTGEKLESLVSSMEDYCQKYNHQSCLEFVNEARTHEGLIALDPLHISMEDTMTPEEHASLDAMLSNIKPAQEPAKIEKNSSLDLEPHM